jgi:hypothetical protein
MDHPAAVDSALALLRAGAAPGDGAAAQVTPVMGMPAEFRLATVTNYLVDMDARLQHSRFHGSSTAAALRGQIREFNSIALSVGGATR